jgi:probable phosphoglycerate mutase
MRLMRATSLAAARPGARLLRCLALVGLLGLLAPGCARPGAGGTTTVFLVRHAEKQPDSQDPDLTEAGRQRALSLVQTLRSVPLDAIYSTDTHRTRQTAEPLAQARSLEVEIYDKDDLAHLAMKLRGTPGRYLVVGHSNTTPDLVHRLGGEPGATIDEQREFDRLYVLVLHPDGSVVTVLLRYGDDLERSRTNLPGGTPN